MAVIKRLIIILVIGIGVLAVGLLFTYEVIKMDWVSFMEIQQSYSPQEDPLPLPARSIPIQGAAYIRELGVPVNPVSADEASLARGKTSYETSCQLCHGSAGKGDGPFSGFLVRFPPSNLVKPDSNARVISDGAIFLTITDGIDGRMPALKDNLPTAEMRWDVVNYVRYLQSSGQ